MTKLKRVDAESELSSWLKKILVQLVLFLSNVVWLRMRTDDGLDWLYNFHIR